MKSVLLKKLHIENAVVSNKLRWMCCFAVLSTQPGETFPGGFAADAFVGGGISDVRLLVGRSWCPPSAEDFRGGLFLGCN